MPQGPLNPSNTSSVISRMMDNGMQMSPDPAVAASQQGQPSHVPMYGALGVMGAGQLADILSTRAALARGGVEGNSGVYGKTPSFGKVVGIKSAAMIPLALLLNKLYESHPKLAAGLALGAGGAGFGAAIHNSKTNK